MCVRVGACIETLPRVGDKCGRVKPAAQSTQSGRQAWETSGKENVKACGPEHPEWETSVGKKCGRQVKS